MGMYTELYLTCSLKQDIPDNVRMFLEFWFDINKPEPSENVLPDHELFKCDRWRIIGKCASYYFVPFATSKLYFDNGVTNRYYLTTRFDLKNYGSEIEKFLDFLTPFIDNHHGEHIGHIRYEENEEPTLIYHSESDE